MRSRIEYLIILNEGNIYCSWARRLKCLCIGNLHGMVAAVVILIGVDKIVDVLIKNYTEIKKKL